MSPETKYRLLTTLMLATAAGGGTSFLLNALSDVKDLQKKRKVEEALSSNVEGTKVIIDPDNVKTYLEESINKSASSEDKKLNTSDTNTMTSAMLEALGGLLALGGGYYGANKLYEAYKKSLVEDELADNKNDYYTQLYLLNKSNKDKISKGKANKYGSNEETAIPSRKAGITDALGLGAGLLLLSGLASALMSRQLLKDKYPLLNRQGAYSAAIDAVLPPKLDFKVESKKPVVSDSNLKEDIKKALQDEATEEDELKLASDISSLLNDEVNESILKLAYQSENLKPDSIGIQSIVNCVANGHLAKLKTASTIDEMFDIADTLNANQKFASVDSLNTQFAFSVASKDPFLKEAVMPLAAVQILYAYPTQNKLASQVEMTPITKKDFSIICTITNMLSKQAAMQSKADQIESDITKVASIVDQGRHEIEFDYGVATHNAIVEFLERTV